MVIFFYPKMIYSVTSEGPTFHIHETIRVQSTLSDVLAPDVLYRRKLCHPRTDQLRDDEQFVIVCFENPDQKRCHRTLLEDHTTEQL